MAPKSRGMARGLARSPAGGCLLGGLASALVLCAWLGPRVTHLGPLRLARDSGQVCFYSDNAPDRVQAFVSPGCYAADCTRPLRQSARAWAEPGTIHLTSLFVLRELNVPPGSRQCGADCGGGGTVKVEVDGLGPGTYAVKWGSQRVGELTLPLDQASACFDDKPPFPNPLTPAPTSPGWLGPATATAEAPTSGPPNAETQAPGTGYPAPATPGPVPSGYP